MHTFATGDPVEFIKAAHARTEQDVVRLESVQLRVAADRAILAEHEIRDGRCRVCAAHGSGPADWARFVAPCPTICCLAEGWGWEWVPAPLIYSGSEEGIILAIAAQNGDL